MFELSPMKSNYDPIMTDDERIYMDTYLSRASMGAMPRILMKCNGNECKLIKHCPINKMDKQLPLGDVCPVEHALIERIADDLLMDICDGETDEISWTDKAMAFQYARWNIVQHRADAQVSDDGNTEVDSFRGITRDGEAIYERRLKPSFSLAEQAQRNMDRILKQLIATRESKAKISSSARGSDNALVRQILNKAKTMRKFNNATDAETEIKDD